jgi:hypothetical protein
LPAAGDLHYLPWVNARRRSVNANLNGPERGLIDEALFEGGRLLPDPMDDVPEEALLEAATGAPPEPVVVRQVQVVFPPQLAPTFAEEGDAPAGPAPRPLRLECIAGLTLAPGDRVTLTPADLCISGADSPFLIDILLLSAPRHGTLLRDGFALAAGDAFTQEDIDHGRISYRHDGACGEDGFTFATPEGEVPPTEFRLTAVSTRRAPELTRPGRLPGVQESCKVADILGDAVRCHEPDAEAGLAVVGVKGRGEWAYSTDGEEWRPLGDVHPGNALLLEPTSAVRFLPLPGWCGRAALTYRAWDRSGHEAGRPLDLSAPEAVGGASAFSAEVAVATATIRAANRGAGVEPWRGQPAVGDLVGAGLAVVRLEGQGIWQYSLDDGRAWLDFGEAYHGRAVLLGADARVRFLPRPGGTGKVVLAGRLWEGRDGSAGEIVNLSGHRASGDGTPFSEFVQTRTWRLGGD